MDPEVINKIKRIKLLILDVDGVLTDGKIYLSEKGEEMKVFHARDGAAHVRARKQGLIIAWVSGRRAEAVVRRARQLGIKKVYQGIDEKMEVMEKLRKEYSCREEEVAYMGDDLSDLPLLQKVGFSATVADAHPAVQEIVDYKSSRGGGLGAVTEVIDLILNHQTL